MLCVVDCEALPYNTSSVIKITDVSDATVTGTANTQFESSYSLECKTGYYFSQEEFSQCGKSWNAASVYIFIMEFLILTTSSPLSNSDFS